MVSRTFQSINLELLRIAEIVHVGSETTCGLGQFVSLRRNALARAHDGLHRGRT
jgi:hypothetical protein